MIPAAEWMWRLAFAVNVGFLFVNYFQDDTRGMIFSGFMAVICMPFAFKTHYAFRAAGRG